MVPAITRYDIAHTKHKTSHNVESASLVVVVPIYARIQYSPYVLSVCRSTRRLSGTNARASQHENLETMALVYPCDAGCTVLCDQAQWNRSLFNPDSRWYYIYCRSCLNIHVYMHVCKWEEKKLRVAPNSTFHIYTRVKEG